MIEYSESTMVSLWVLFISISVGILAEKKYFKLLRSKF